MEIFLEKSETFFLVFVRITAFLAVSPFYSNKSFPNQVRISLGFLLAILILPGLNAIDMKGANVVSYIVLVGKEVLVGLVLGYAAKFIFFGVRAAGRVLSFLLGFSIVSSFNPDAGEQMSIIGHLKWLLALYLFLIMDGHFLLIEGLAKSFQIVPLMKASFPDPLFEYFVRLSAQVFTVAIQISAPALVTLFMTNVSLGMLARMVPQMNVFVVGFPLTISVGLFSLIIILPIFSVFMQGLLAQVRESLAIIMRILAG